MFRYLLFLLLGFSVQAQTFIWNGKGDKQSWNDPSNWSGGVVPGGSILHNVVINDASMPVNLNITTTIGQLKVIGSHFTVPSGITLTISNPSAATTDTIHGLDLRNATFSLNGILSLYMQGDDHCIGSYNSTFNGNSGSLIQNINAANPPQKGILIKSGITTFQNGSEIVLTTTKQAIENWATLECLAQVELVVGEEGIWNYGTLTLADSLILSTSGSTRFHSIYNEGSLVNNAFLRLDGSRKHSIKNLGTFTNNGNILMRSLGNFTPETGSATVHNENLFTNNGSIQCISLLENNLKNINSTSGFTNNGTWTSSGAIGFGAINSGTSSDSSKITNSGSMTINKGLENTSFSSFRNTGTCEVSTQGIINSGFLSSTDSLLLDVSGTALDNSGTLELSGLLEVLGAQNAITNTGSILNNGTIRSNNLLGLGNHHFKNTGITTNYGTIIHLNGNKGILNEAGSFTNFGTLRMKGLSDVHLYNYGVDSSIFINYGGLDLSQNAAATDSLIYNGTKGRITSTGSIEADSMFYFAKFIRNLGKVENFGSLSTSKMDVLFLDNSGTWASLPSSILTFDFSLNELHEVFLNSGILTLDGISSFIFDNTYAKNDPFLENTGSITLKGKTAFEGGGGSGFLLNHGTFTLQDTLEINLARVRSIENFGTVTLEGHLEMVSSPALISNASFTNNGSILMRSGSGGLRVNQNGTFTNNGNIEQENGNTNTILLNHVTSQFTNGVNGRIELKDNANSLSSTNGVIHLENGTFTNHGYIKVSNSEPTALNIKAGILINNDSLLIQQSDFQEMVRHEAGTFTNNGYLQLDGSTKNNVTLYFLFTPGVFHNSGTIHILDAFSRGVHRQGQFTTNAGSFILFENNNRVSSLPFSDANSSQAVINYGNMKSINSASCIVLQGAAENHGFLDLNTCGISMANGTNKASGFIRSKNLSLVQNNEGILEFMGDNLYTLSGTNIITNNGLIVDRNDSFRNISFNDGGALGFPIWNKGLFINPFYGKLSDGIKEVMNLNFTESGTLPISSTWYTDRALTTTAGTWEQNLHYFTPNANANPADSIYLQTSFGGNSYVLAIPHRLISSCPLPLKWVNTQPKTLYDWSKHTTWRGNRIPNLCDRASLSGQENVLIPSGFHIRVNHFDFTPSLGANRYFEIQNGAVFETNLFPYN